MNSARQEEEEEQGGGIPTELIKSYLAFGVRAVRNRRLLASLIFGGISCLTILVLAIWPRTYRCDTVLMVQGNQMYQDSKQDAMSGAAQVVTRRENLEALVKQAELVKNWERGRSGPFLWKDRLMGKLRGSMSDKDKERALVGTLQQALQVNAALGTLTISIDWSDAEIATRIVGAAQQTFLKSRHTAEVSTLAEYITILEGHAAKVHGEIDTFAAQIQKIRDDRLAEVEKDVAGASVQAEPQKRAPRRAAPAAPAAPTEEALQAKALLESKQRDLKDLQDQRTRRLAELQAKMIELKTRFTGAHPEILSLERTIAGLSVAAAPEQSLKEEVASLKAQLQVAPAPDAPNAPAPAGGGGLPSIGDRDPGAAPISADIMKLMQDTDDTLDPALAAQLRFAVEKYAMLRGKINTGHIDLDTAQAAFRHRYQVIVPPEVPNKAIKPKVPIVLGVGLLVALLLALGASVVLELKTGRLVEHWQIHQIGIPVLAELRLPPGSSD